MPRFNINIKLGHILQHSLFALKASIFLTDWWNTAIWEILKPTQKSQFRA